MKSFIRLATLALMLGGCSSVAMSTPGGFATIEGGGFERRLASASGVVVGVRTEKNELGGNVDFWADALDLRLSNQGYVREKSVAVKARSGEAGRQMRYSVMRNRRPQAYWLTVFANANTVYLVEAAGDRTAFDPQVAVVDQTIASFRIR